jgi:hypothetical protein
MIFFSHADIVSHYNSVNRTQFSNNPSNLSSFRTTRGATTKRRDKNCDRNSHDTILLKSRICFLDGWSPTDESSQFSDVGLPPPLPVILNFFPTYIYSWQPFCILFMFFNFSFLESSPVLSVYLLTKYVSCSFHTPSLFSAILPSHCNIWFQMYFSHMIQNFSGRFRCKEPKRKYKVIAWNRNPPAPLFKAVNREDKRSRRYRDRHFAKFEMSRRYRER